MMDQSDRSHARHNLTALIFAALGIVFGDIGTSPLYTVKTVIALAGGKPSPEELLGLLSLVLWALVIIPSVKYITFVMRADNDGEGGILALMSLLGLRKKHHRPLIVMLGLFGAALIYGDGAITPAISVLSAVEGLKVVHPVLASYILPVSVAILTVLFAFQYQGTARIGWVFGPVMGLWFSVLGLLGLWGIIQHPAVLHALNPYHAVHYLAVHGKTGFLVLGGVFLAVTGAEALYADMGHIGIGPIRLAWFGLVFPSLLLNYAGQTAYVLADGSVDNTFYGLCPEGLLAPMIVLATVATIIASQAIITGAYSMTRQAIQLGWCPRLRITQTSAEGYGQIYIGAVNWLLMAVTIGITITFGSSDNLAAAYGIAVSMTMLLTSALLMVAMHEIWKWNVVLSLVVAGVFLCVDFVFFVSNFTKVLEGGWVPLLLAVVIFGLMRIWHSGYAAMLCAIREKRVPATEFFANLETNRVVRIPGTGVFLTRTINRTPHLIQWHVTRNRCLYRTVIALAVVIEQVPWVRGQKRIEVEVLAPSFWRVVARYGFMERPNIPFVMTQVNKMVPEIAIDDLNYYIGRETIIPRRSGHGSLPLWQESIYAFMQRNASHIADYYKIPVDRLMEIGRQVEV